MKKNKKAEALVVSINISTKKGTIKKPVTKADFTFNGIEKDAHSGPWHRQVSMLGRQSIERFEKTAGRKIMPGEFAENITIDGVDLRKVRLLDRFIGCDVEFEITQIGKKCHGDNCAIYREVGNCVMPKEGIFLRVLRAGIMRRGENLLYHAREFRFTVITLSDRASKGEYEDLSGPAIRKLITEHFEKSGRPVKFKHIIIPDEAALLRKEIRKAIKDKADGIFTTGGTGIGPRDITPEVVKPMLGKEIPGIMEAIRVKYGAEKPNALLTRGVAGIIGDSFVYTLPGSVKAVNEYIPEIMKTFEHLVLMRRGIDAH